jgi:hypothetical protein
METVSACARARARPISEADILSLVDVIRLIPLSGGIEVRAEANNVTAAARLCVRIALDVTTRGCGTAPDTFPSWRRRVNRCSRKRKKDRERECKKRIELSGTVKRYISDAIVIGERRAVFPIRARFAVISGRENSRSAEDPVRVPFRIMPADNISFDPPRMRYRFTL